MAIEIPRVLEVISEACPSAMWVQSFAWEQHSRVYLEHIHHARLLIHLYVVQLERGEKNAYL